MEAEDTIHNESFWQDIVERVKRHNKVVHTGASTARQSPRRRTPTDSQVATGHEPAFRRAQAPRILGWFRVTFRAAH